MIAQIGVVLFSCLAIYFVARKDKLKRWGYIFGLCSQPFWFYTVIVNEQWGIFLLTCFYTVQWAKGICNYWVDEE